MAAQTTMTVAEVIVPFITRSPTTVTGAGVTSTAAEYVFASSDAEARVTLTAVEVVVGIDSTGQHGDLRSGTIVTTTVT